MTRISAGEFIDFVDEINEQFYDDEFKKLLTNLKKTPEWCSLKMKHLQHQLSTLKYQAKSCETLTRFIESNYIANAEYKKFAKHEIEMKLSNGGGGYSSVSYPDIDFIAPNMKDED